MLHCIKNVRMKFYRTFNSIYYKSRGADSELSSVHLFKSYCLPFILYATEAIPLSKTAVTTLDDCIKRAIVKIFNVRDNDNIYVTRLNCDLPHISTMIERRRLKFVNKLLDSRFYVRQLC